MYLIQFMIYIDNMRAFVLFTCIAFGVFSLRELATLVDQSWRMDIGGTLREEPVPL